PVPYDPSKLINIQSPNFNSEDPSTWGFPPPERLVFGLGIRAGRLFYGVADGLSVWSVAIGPNFGDNPRLELQVPPGEEATEIAKIVFDERGRMYLAERPAPNGTYDLETLTPESVGRVLRYSVVSVNPDGSPVWQSDADEYAIGFPGEYRN